MRIAIDTPDNVDEGKEDGCLSIFLNRAFKKDKKILAMARKLMKKLSERDSPDFMRSEENIGYKPLEHRSPLKEIQVPVHSKSGVGRIYCVLAKDDPQKIILLEAEIKHGAPSKLKMDAAEKKYKAIKK